MACLEGGQCPNRDGVDWVGGLMLLYFDAGRLDGFFFVMLGVLLVADLLRILGLVCLYFIEHYGCYEACVSCKGLTINFRFLEVKHSFRKATISGFDEIQQRVPVFMR